MSATKISIETSEKKFKSFHETFPYCAFALACALIYPNRANNRKRVITFGILMSFDSLMLFWFVSNLAICAYTFDKYDLSRNLSVGIVVAVFFFKFFYVYIKNDKFADLLANITDDLLKGNDMDEDYQAIYEEYIKLGKIGQTCWIIIPILLSTQFPIYATVLMIYESLTKDDGERYMVHEMRLQFIDNKKYETPYFEVVFIYSLVQCVVLCPNFAGLDGSFCIASNHLCLKIKLLAHKVHRAFKDSNNRYQLEMNVKEAVKEHQEAIKFYNDLQHVYGGWLFIVFLLTSILISMNLYQIHLSESIDTKYTIFAVSEELSWDIYDVPWESWADPVVTKLLIFMIAKSQETFILTGKGIVYFNMQLFISVLQTGYSFFTLISS
ncbi:jg3263 [Pararge aegeria aegeria]|uniref:Odorant receptor n=1 Tax=Pararge aegeria aegeria TaxID=348720 RepID=A0A8S4RUC5_9NEOP|nr:jg3263 [Pararge aegeria aegeria]